MIDQEHKDELAREEARMAKLEKCVEDMVCVKCDRELDNGGDCKCGCHQLV